MRSRFARSGLIASVALLGSLAAAFAADPAAAGDPLAGLRPSPGVAVSDKGVLTADGCMAQAQQVYSKRCVYGVPGSRQRVVVFGDSRALQYFDPLVPVAMNRSWRLVGLTRGNCPVAQVSYETYCDAWRENSLQRIERERPDLVIVANATKSMYRVTTETGQLTRAESQSYLVTGFASTLRRIRATGAAVVVIRDQSLAPFVPADCLLASPQDFSACSFPAAPRLPRAFELRGAQRVGVRTIDPQSLFCPGGTCQPVIDGRVVFRDSYHLSATYARTLRPWLVERLPRLRD